MRIPDRYVIRTDRFDRTHALVGWIERMNREHPELFSPEAVEMIKAAKKELKE